MNKPKKRKKKNKIKANIYAFCAFLLMLTALAAIFFLLFKLSGGEEDSSVSGTGFSEPAETGVSSAAPAESEASSGVPETSDAVPALKSYEEYENYIGIKYKIDVEEWEQYIAPENESSYVFAVSKKYPLAKDYVPAGLVDVLNTRKDRPPEKMIGVAEMALRAFLLEAAENGITDVTVTSAYRTYAWQKANFDLKCEQNKNMFPTREEVEAYVSLSLRPPGLSEHQTGLVADMHNMSEASSAFAGTPAAVWLGENAHRFGFTVSYQEGKTDITGVKYEPWHFRYVGRTAATDMYLRGLCLEEYVELEN